MSVPNGRVTISFGGEDREFNIAVLKYALELQDICNCGPQELLARFLNGTWRLTDLRETIRIGLIGAGMEPGAAQKLVKTYVDERPWMESLPTVKVIVMAALVGIPGDEPGKKAIAERTPTEDRPSSETAALSVPQSTDLAQDSGSTRAPLIQ